MRKVSSIYVIEKGMNGISRIMNGAGIEIARGSDIEMSKAIIELYRGYCYKNICTGKAYRVAVLTNDANEYCSSIA